MIKQLKLLNYFLGWLLCVVAMGCGESNRQKSNQRPQVINHSVEMFETKEVTFESEGVTLAGTVVIPENPAAGVVLVHGSDSVPRMLEFAKLLAQHQLLVFTYDKRGVGQSGGVYVGPEVGTNNIIRANLEVLATDASAAVDKIHQEHPNLALGLLGFSQAGWIIPIAATNNANIRYMVLFSGPTITTLEQLRFQFYTNGNTEFWDTHTEADAIAHTKNDPDRYQFKATDPVEVLNTVDISGLWLFGEKDIQIPVTLCIDNLNQLKAQGKPFNYVIFPALGHNTSPSAANEPLQIAIAWIKSEAGVVN